MKILQFSSFHAFDPWLWCGNHLTFSIVTTRQSRIIFWIATSLRSVYVQSKYTLIDNIIKIHFPIRPTTVWFRLIFSFEPQIAIFHITSISSTNYKLHFGYFIWFVNPINSIKFNSNIRLKNTYLVCVVDVDVDVVADADEWLSFSNECI